MRAFVTQGGIPTFIALHEQKFLDENFEHGDTVFKQELSEREAEIARNLTSRGVLNRYSDAEKGIYFKRNTNRGI